MYYCFREKRGAIISLEVFHPPTRIVKADMSTNERHLSKDLGIKPANSIAMVIQDKQSFGAQT